jgi:transposase
MKNNRPRYTTEFKQKISELRESGKGVSEIAREYGIAKQSISNWHKQYKTSGSFKASDNLSDEEKELRQLRKDNKRLLMEVDILKQAALIMGRNDE